MKTPFFLYSLNDTTEEELNAVINAFGENNVSCDLTKIPSNSVVVPRYRSIPFGKELETEVKGLGSELVNSFYQHRQVADLMAWVNLLDGYTPKAYLLEDYNSLPEGEYFIKGETNSLKNRWFDAAYAPDKASVIRIAENVMSDLYLTGQRIIIRPFQHFRKLIDGVDGRPIFHERRVFVLDGKVLSQGFYWSSFVDEVGEVSAIDENKYNEFLNLVVDKVKDVARFLVVDFAEYPDGSWAVVELNDGCMSGLSENDPNVLWEAFVDHFKTL